MSNFIKDIEIENFKSIRHQKIDGCKKVNVFIGYPNVGKSNVLEALSVLGYIKAGTPKPSKLFRFGNFSEIFFDGTISKPAQVYCNSVRRVVLSFDSDSDLYIGCDAFIDSEKGFWTTVKSFDIDQKTITENKLDVFAENFRDRSKISEITVKKYEYKREIQKDESHYHSLFFPDGQNLFYIIESQSALRKEVAELFDHYDLKLAFEKGNKYSLRILKPLQDGTIFLIPFYQIADTLQRLIFYKAAIQTNKETVLVFEEPEAHMFPPYIRKFTGDIIFDKTNQFFIATHSPYVLEEFLEEIPNDLAIYLVDYKNGETVIKPLSEKDLEEVRKFGVDLFFNLESYLNNGEVNNA